MPTPAFDGRCSGLERLDGSLLGGADDEGQAEHEDDDDERGNSECDQRGICSSGDERLCGQTGQDGTCSTEPGGQVAESEQCESQERVLTAGAAVALSAQEPLHGRFEAAE